MIKFMLQRGGSTLSVRIIILLLLLLFTLAGTLFYQYQILKEVKATSQYSRNDFSTDSNYSYTTVNDTKTDCMAFFKEDWNENSGNWFSRRDLKLVTENKNSFLRLGDGVGAYDLNHPKNFGVIDLLLWMFVGPVPEGSSDKSAYLGGGNPDLRNAKISLKLRGHNFVPNGAKFIFWIQSQQNIELLRESNWRRSNWGYTGYPLTKSLQSGNWVKTEFTLFNKGSMWTYSGNNPKDERPWRYSFAPLNSTLGNVNYDIIFMLYDVDPKNHPKGKIDFDDFYLCYKNKSLIHPVNGGKLLKGRDYKGRLTDGWRHGKAKMWSSSKKGSFPQSFTYKLEKRALIKTVQIHQNPDCQAKRVQVFFSKDGKTYSPEIEATIPKAVKGQENFSFFIKSNINTQADFVKFSIVEGYDKGCVGLGELEVFGSIIL